MLSPAYDVARLHVRAAEPSQRQRNVDGKPAGLPGAHGFLIFRYGTRGVALTPQHLAAVVVARADAPLVAHLRSQLETHVEFLKRGVPASDASEDDAEIAMNINSTRGIVQTLV